jgi:hypothetical protein
MSPSGWVAVCHSRRCPGKNTVPHTLPGMDWTCSICLDTLAGPVVLPCGHSYCAHCFNQWARASTAEHGGSAKCPICRADAPATLGGATQRALLDGHIAHRRYLAPVGSLWPLPKPARFAAARRVLAGVCVRLLEALELVHGPRPAQTFVPSCEPEEEEEAASRTGEARGGRGGLGGGSYACVVRGDGARRTLAPWRGRTASAAAGLRLGWARQTTGRGCCCCALQCPQLLPGVRMPPTAVRRELAPGGSACASSQLPPTPARRQPTTRAGGAAACL